MAAGGFKEEYSKEMLERLGARIRQLRKDRGYMNYEKISYDYNISRAQWGRYEKGQNITFLLILKIVKALEVTLEEFFRDFNTDSK